MVQLQGLKGALDRLRIADEQGQDVDDLSPTQMLDMTIARLEPARAPASHDIRLIRLIRLSSIIFLRLSGLNSLQSQTVIALSKKPWHILVLRRSLCGES